MHDDVPNNAADEEASRELLALADAWAAAIVSNDADAIGRFMHDDWVIVSRTGVSAKSRFLSFVASGDLTHDTM